MGLELLNLLAVLFEKCVSVDHFLFFCISELMKKKKSIPNATHLLQLLGHTRSLLICFAKSRVFILSDTAPAPGLMVQMTLMWALSDSEGCSIHVSFEFR
jgi:hypothetical protein